ncbi:MAG TPA: FGGY-family carbohydrate kinase [Pseudolysinimonas sp.]|nr:FGGY-family carbohydrate kinase [Pseudolysinimonas sp.]
MGPVVLAVDIGSSGVRCLGYRDDYRVVAVSERPLRTTDAADGRSTHDWREVEEATIAAIADLAARFGDVRAVAMSGTASSLARSRRMPDGRPGEIGDVLLWSDTRAAAFADSAEEGAARYERTLCPSHISYWPAKLRWFAREGHDPGVLFAGAKDYLFELLTGRFWVDPMTAAATGVFDSTRWNWDETLVATGLTAANLPEVHAAIESAPLRTDLAARTGLPAGTPIVLGGMDGPLAQLGASGFATDAHTCTVGTSLAYRAGVQRRTVDPQQRVWCYPVFDDFWVAGGAGSNGGNVFTWLAAVLGAADVGELVAQALQMAPEPSLLFLPYFHGERAPLWSDDIRAALVGLAAHHGAADIARAALDGVAAAALELAAAVTDVAGPAREVRLTGGFVRSPEWTQLVTDALGAPSCVPDPDAATSTGAAVLAWMSLGHPRPAAPLPAVATQQRTPRAEVHDALLGVSQRLRRVRRALEEAR